MPSGKYERFRIIRGIGRGGMGEVFLAYDSVLRRRVALKKLFESDVADPESRRRLLHEARAAARLNHPNIASIYDVVELDGSDCIVMEYVPGESLADRINERAFESSEAVRIGIQVAKALAAAHAVGVIHRDLKPANIRLSPDGTAKILDFGLARTHHTGQIGSSRSTASASSSTQTADEDTREMAGTLPYMPPETLRGEVAGARGDIYSLGVTLFQMLTGRCPFIGTSTPALIAAITSQPTPRVSEVASSISQDLSAVIAKAMAREPAARYPSGQLLADALERLGKRGLKIRRWAAIAAALIAVLFVGLWVSGPFDTPQSKADSKVVAVLPFLSLSPDSVASYVAAGISDVVNANLATLPFLVVRTQETIRYHDPNRDLEAVARELGASLLIDGSVQKYGDQLRVTVRMSRMGSKALDWTDIKDGDATNVLRLQEDILASLLDGLLTLEVLSNEPDEATRARLTRPPTRNEDASAEYSQALAFLERDDIPENIPRAIRLFEAAVQKDPNFAQALGGLAEACFAQYRRTRDSEWAQRAIQATANALALDPDRVNVRYSRSVILFGTGALDEAEEELERIIRERPNHDAAHGLLADVYVKQGRKHEAIRELHNAIRLRRAYWRHHWSLATVLYEHGEYDEAVKEAQRVTELQPDNPRGYQLLGTIFQAQEKVDQAMEAYDTSLRLAPTAGAYSNVGGKFFDEGDFERAATYYRKAVATDPKMPVYYRNLGDTLVELGQSEESKGTYAMAVALADSSLLVNPNDASMLALRALCLAKLDNEEALQGIAAAEQLTPANPNVLYKKTAILALLGHPNEALHALEKALAVGVPPSFAIKDPDLRSISDTEEFKRLVNR